MTQCADNLALPAAVGKDICCVDMMRMTAFKIKSQFIHDCTLAHFLGESIAMALVLVYFKLCRYNLVLDVSKFANVTSWKAG